MQLYVKILKVKLCSYGIDSLVGRGDWSAPDGARGNWRITRMICLDARLIRAVGEMNLEEARQRAHRDDLARQPREMLGNNVDDW